MPGYRFAKPYRLYRPSRRIPAQVAGSRIDDLQHLGGRGLLFQGLARLSR